MMQCMMTPTVWCYLLKIAVCLVGMACDDMNSLCVVLLKNALSSLVITVIRWGEIVVNLSDHVKYAYNMIEVPSLFFKRTMFKAVTWIIGRGTCILTWIKGKGLIKGLWNTYKASRYEIYTIFCMFLYVSFYIMNFLTICKNGQKHTLLPFLKIIILHVFAPLRSVCTKELDRV